MNYQERRIKTRIRDMETRRIKYINHFLRSFFMAMFALAVCVIIAAGSIAAGMVCGMIDNAPEVDLHNIQPDRFATTVYDARGNVMQRLVSSGANREAAVYEEIPEHLINAFIAIEDARFWTHNGIDLRSIGRAAFGILTGDYAGGGSTITQQLIKNNVLSGGLETSWGARIERKIQEQYMAVQLEQNSEMEKEDTKKFILTNYLNTINLGNNSLGVKVAARRYFGKEVSELTLSECTVLAPITQNPSGLNPITGREANEERRRIVLQNMYELGYITKEEQEEALADPVYERIQTVETTNQENNAPYSYFTDELVSQVIQSLMEHLDYTETQASNLLYSGGLQIYSTQDPDIQAIVDEEVNNPENYEAAKFTAEYRLSILRGNGETEHYSEKNLSEFWREISGNSGFDGLYETEDELREGIERYKAWLLTDQDEVIAEYINPVLQPQVSFVVMDHHTGEVKAVSGGRGEKKASLTLNRATDTVRQPGSAFKVITAFAPALDTCGATLGTVYYDAPYTVGQKSFRNWWGQSRGYMGYSNIRDGIVYSMNIVAVRAMMETVTPQLGVDYARNMGITTLTDSDINAAAALGGITNGVTNLELTAAYASIANEGTYTKPRFFTRILDREGRILVDNRPESRKELKESTAFLLTDAMADSLEPNRLFARDGVLVSSTSTGAALSNQQAAGKSGTTSDNVDVWFVGYTPYYTAGVWGGCDENQPLRTGSVNNGGTNYHKEIWKNIMERIHEGLPDIGFRLPDSVVQETICKKSGKKAIPGICEHDPRGNTVYNEYFSRESIPQEICDSHAVMNVCIESGHLAGEYCPQIEERVMMILPEGEHGITDDTYYSATQSCGIHLESVIEMPMENGSIQIPEEPERFPVGPGYWNYGPRRAE